MIHDPVSNMNAPKRSFYIHYASPNDVLNDHQHYKLDLLNKLRRRNGYYIIQKHTLLKDRP